MARKKRKARRAAPRRNVARVAAPKRRRARHTRRNPPAAIRGILALAEHAGVGAFQVLAGKIGVRKLRGLAGQKAGTLLGSLMEAGIGLGAGMLVARMVSPLAGERVAIGGFLAPMETLVQQLGIPHISDSLGDDGYMLTGDLGYVVSDDRTADGYNGRNVLGDDDDDLAGYVAAGDDLGDAFVANEAEYEGEGD